eukprot:2232411-Pleurochrysis_carterae.AAC.1
MGAEASVQTACRVRSAWCKASEHSAQSVRFAWAQLTLGARGVAPAVSEASRLLGAARSTLPAAAPSPSAKLRLQTPAPRGGKRL